MKKLIMLALALVLVFSLAACGESTDKDNSGGNSTNPPASQGGTETPSGNNGGEIDLSKYTPVDVPDWDIVEDWMVPEFGVITKASEMLKDYMYSLTVAGTTTANVESYTNKLIENGMTKTSIYTYEKDAVRVSIGTAAVGTTKDNEMTISIHKK